MNKVEENIKNILNDLKNSRFDNEILKKDLILLISKYSSNPYPYINRLWIDGYIMELSTILFKILSLEFKSNTIDSHIIKEGYEEA